MKNEILRVMSDVFEIDFNDFKEEINQKNIDNWDSLRHLNFIVELEELFSVSFEPEEISEMNSIDKILEILQQKMSK